MANYATQTDQRVESPTGKIGVQGRFPYLFDQTLPVGSTGVGAAVPVFWNSTANTVAEWNNTSGHQPIGIVWNDEVDASDIGTKRYANTDVEVRSFGSVMVKAKGQIRFNDRLVYNGDGTWSAASGNAGNGMVMAGLEVISVNSASDGGFADAYVSVAPASYDKSAGSLNFGVVPNPVIVRGVVGATANLSAGRGVKKSSGKYIAGTDASIDGIILPQSAAYAVDGTCFVAIDAAIAIETTAAMKAGDRTQYGGSNKFVTHSATQQYSAILLEDAPANGTPWARFRA